MNELMKKLQKPLEAHEIEFRVQSIGNKNINGSWRVCAQMLAYKDARSDMRRVDEVFGFAGWQRLHKEHKGMLFGGVAIQNEKGEWIEKWDVGEASNAHADKGLASDSFKRACFNLGIGRELYDYPEILVPLNHSDNNFETEYTVEQNGNRKNYKAGFALNPKQWIWFSQFDEDGNLSYLGAKDKNGMRFNWGIFRKEEEVE